MAAALLRSVLRRNGLLPSFETYRLRDLLFFSSSVDTAAAVGGTISPDPHFMVEYLVNSCGFSPFEAAKFSEPLRHLRSTEKPDAVLNFMRSQGFDGAGIRKVISGYPSYLCVNVEKNLAPKFQFLRDLGLSESDIVDAILKNHAILRHNVHRSFVPKLEIWESLLGSRELGLKRLKKSGWFFFSSVEKTLHPNLKFLRDECGIPEERLSLVLRSHPQLISQKPKSLRALVARVDELGMPRQSRMFMWTLDVFHNVSKERIEAKVELMRSFGWSESEFSSAVRKAPTFLRISLDMLRRKVEFFINIVGYTPSFIASHPNLLLSSLQKRVIPRFRVLEILNTKGLWTRRGKFSYYVTLSNTKFMEKFVLPYKEKVLEILLSSPTEIILDLRNIWILCKLILNRGLNGIWKTSFCVDQDYQWFGTHPFLCMLNGLQRIRTCGFASGAVFSPTMAAATLRSNSLLPLFETCRLRDLLFFSSSVDAAAAACGTTSPDPHFMVEYLVNSCGFSPSEAAKFSNPLRTSFHRETRRRP
ncbi:hypothetical protein C4D60_Mb10t06570 [Musa balbisiana]|uniref:Uncharacterized protein n=1 Tax=Musa balbisiana TaxID=52838 RepID=A0A4S8IVZ9_MUSBA|nr:hypothetical protein C4D60_Mb10t06570 [Musa balbisiana]